MSKFESLIRFFAIKARTRRAAGLKNSRVSPDAITYSHPALRELSAALDRARELLLDPTPQSVRAVTLIVEEVGTKIGKLSGTEFGEQSWGEVRSLHDQIGRTRRLIEGSLRIQWANLRRLMALTQSYAPPGRISQFKDRWPRVDLKV